MMFKVDENLPHEAVAVLAAAGHDVQTVYDEQLNGRPDAEVAAHCQHERRALVTLDLDFSDIRAYPPRDYSGIIVLRPHSQSKRDVLSLLAALVPLLANEPLDGHLWIVSESGVRIRGA